MPIYPHYESSTQVAAPTTPLPSPTNAGADLQNLGGAIFRGGLEGAQVARKRKSLEDESLVLQRYMQAVSEMESNQESLRGADALDAKGKFGEFVGKRAPEWYKDLSPEATEKLNHRLFSRQLEYQAGAGRIENRARTDRLGAALLGGERNIVDGVNKGRILGDPKEHPDYTVFSDAIDEGVALGYMTREEAAKTKLRVLQTASYDAAYRLVVDAPEEYLKLYDRSEKGDVADTPMGNLEGKQRLVLKAQAEERIRTKRYEAEHIEDRARAAQERYQKELTEFTEISVEKRLRGEGPPMTIQDLDLYGSLRLLTGEKYRFYREAMVNNLIEGGSGDPETIRKVGIRVAELDSTPENIGKVREMKDVVRQGVLDKKIPFKQGLTWLKGLDERERAEDSPLRRQSNEVRSLVKEALRVSGPMAEYVNSQVQSVLTEALEDITRNEWSQSPEAPLALYHRLKPEWQSRARLPARGRLQELRKSVGLPPRTKDEGPDESFDALKAKLREEYLASPASAKRDEILMRVRRLEEIKNLQEQIDRWLLTPSSASSAAAPKPAASSSYTPPVSGPR